MQQQTLPILINLFAAFIGACGQYLYKSGSQSLGHVPIYFNWQILLGMILFTAVMVCFVWSFRLGGHLSITYPMYATTFIWGTLLGIMLDKEPWSAQLVVGVIIVFTGLFLIATHLEA